MEEIERIIEEDKILREEKRYLLSKVQQYQNQLDITQEELKITKKTLENTLVFQKQLFNYKEVKSQLKKEIQNLEMEKRKVVKQKEQELAQLQKTYIDLKIKSRSLKNFLQILKEEFEELQTKEKLYEEIRYQEKLNTYFQLVIRLLTTGNSKKYSRVKLGGISPEVNQILQGFFPNFYEQIIRDDVMESIEGKRIEKLLKEFKINT